MAARKSVSVSIPIVEVAHVHSYVTAPPRFTVKVEKNSRGTNYELSYSGENLDEIVLRLQEAKARIEETFGLEVEVPQLRQVS